MFIKSVGRIFLGMRVLTCGKFYASVVVGKQGSEVILGVLTADMLSRL